MKRLEKNSKNKRCTTKVTLRGIPKLNIELPYEPAIPLLGMYPKKWEQGLGYLYTNVHKALFKTAKKCKQPKYSSTGEWINKRWNIHTMGYYAVLKTYEILIYATTCINLENIMRSETNPTRKANTVWFHFYKVPRIGKFKDTESIIKVSRGWGGTKSYLFLMGSKFLFGMRKKFWKWIVVIMAQHCGCKQNCVCWPFKRVAVSQAISP